MWITNHTDCQWVTYYADLSKRTARHYNSLLQEEEKNKKSKEKKMQQGKVEERKRNIHKL